MTIGERIKERRKELNLTQTELAKRLGYKSKVAISNVENDKEDLTTTRVKKYAEALECTPEYLMGWNISTFGDGKSYASLNPDELYIQIKPNLQSKDRNIVEAYLEKYIEYIEQNKTYTLNLDEQKLLNNYRKADDLTKSMVKKILEI